MISDEIVQVWITSCIRSYNWTPHYCKRLYLDDMDVLGLKFWHDDAIEVHKINNPK